MFDLSTLPKIKTHTNLAAVGEGPGCSIWNPLTYTECINQVRNANIELANSQTAIIDLATAWQTILNDIYLWPDSPAKTNALDEATQRYNSARQLVNQHTQVMNDFNNSIQPYRNIPGFDVIFLNGLKGVGKVGFIPLWGVLTFTTIIVSVLVAWGISSALALKSNYEAQAAYYNQFVTYYQTCKELAAQGKPCDITGPATSAPDTAWGSTAVTWAVLLGLGALVVVNLTRR